MSDNQHLTEYALKEIKKGQEKGYFPQNMTIDDYYEWENRQWDRIRNK